MAQKADVAAVVMQEGLANLVLVTPAMTLLRAKVEVTIPRKRRGSCTQHEKVSGRCPQSMCKPTICWRPYSESPPTCRLWRGSTKPSCRPSYATSTLTVGPTTHSSVFQVFHFSFPPRWFLLRCASRPVVWRFKVVSHCDRVEILTPLLFKNSFIFINAVSRLTSINNIHNYYFH